MDEYIDFYCEYLSDFIRYNGAMVCVNDIKVIDEATILKFAEEYKIKKDKFYNLFEGNKQYDVDAFWKLCLRLWAYVGFYKRVFVSELTAIDEYKNFLYYAKDGFTKIEFSRKGQRVQLKNKGLIDLVTSHLLNMDEEINNTIPQILEMGVGKPAIEVVGKRNMAYLLAKELTNFILEYKGIKKLTSEYKKDIMSVLYSFNLLRDIGLDSDYNKLMSDVNTGKLQITDSNSTVFTLQMEDGTTRIYPIYLLKKTIQMKKK